MTRAEAIRRIKFVAEWWSPEVAKLDYEEVIMNPGCVMELALSCGQKSLKSILVAAYGAGITDKELIVLTRAWDRCDRRAIRKAIEALDE